MKKKLITLISLLALNAWSQPSPVVRLTSTNGTVTLTPSGGQGVVDISVNGAGLTNLNAPSSNSIYVSLAGSDAAGFGTNLMSPCLTLTNATNIAAHLGGTNCIFIAPGTYQVPDFFGVLTNVTLFGSGPSQTFIEAPVQNVGCVLAIAGDNAGVDNLTITITNLNTVNYMPMLTFTNHATNVICSDLWLFGNSDALDNFSVFSFKYLTTATFVRPHFDSRWDLRVLQAANTAAQASILTFNDGYFYSHMAADQLLRGTTHDIDNISISVIDNNCLTVMANYSISGMAGSTAETDITTNTHNNSLYVFLTANGASICSDQADNGFNVFNGIAPDPGLCDVEPWNGGQQCTFPHATFDVLTVNSFTNVGAIQSDYNENGSPTFYSDGIGNVHANTFSTTGTQAIGSKFIGNGSGLTNTFNSGTNAGGITGNTHGVTNTSTSYGTAIIVSTAGTYSNMDTKGNWIYTNTTLTGTEAFPVGPGAGIGSVTGGITTAKIIFQ